MCKIEIEIPTAGHVTVEVVDILGTHISTLVDSHKEPGKYELDINVLDLNSGKYYYKVFLDPKINGNLKEIVSSGKINIE